MKITHHHSFAPHLRTRPHAGSSSPAIGCPLRYFCKTAADWLESPSSDFIKKIFGKLCEGNKWWWGWGWGGSPWDNSGTNSTISACLCVSPHRSSPVAVSRCRICWDFLDLSASVSTRVSVCLTEMQLHCWDLLQRKLISPWTFFIF